MLAQLLLYCLVLIQNYFRLYDLAGERWEEEGSMSVKLSKVTGPKATVI